jgi:iron(III) transport system substrate-binding protein
MLPDAMALVAHGPNPQGGRLVLDFITSVEGQTMLSQQFGRRPIRNDVAGPNGLPPITSIRVHNMPMEWASANRRAIMDRYTSLVRR